MSICNSNSGRSPAELKGIKSSCGRLAPVGANKDINDAGVQGIQYNHLNLPWKITVKDKGIITYIYDATGNKLEKVTDEPASAANNNTAKNTSTLYLGGFNYENNELKFFSHEEGRIRPKLNAENEQIFVYDYFIKDHLGNVRVVLTDEVQEDKYPAATLETATLETQKLFYNIPDDAATRVDKSTVPGYPTDNTTDPNDFIQKLNGNGTKIGSSITLKVMAGDKVNIKASSWYKMNGVTPDNPVNPLPDLLLALINGVSGAATGIHGSGIGAELQNNAILTPGTTQFLNNQNTPTDKPKAYLNWILFDEQFKMVSTGSSSGVDPVGDNDQLKQHVKDGLEMDKCGYLYVYVSNETPNINVFFDNLQVTHVRGQLLETNEFYPFGLQMRNISYRSAKGNYVENKRMFNEGSELQSKEFIDGSGLEVYDTYFRQLDPQLGRWLQIDPKPLESESPYSAMRNNPTLFNDKLGDTIPNPVIFVNPESSTQNKNIAQAYTKADDNGAVNVYAHSTPYTMEIEENGQRSYVYDVNRIAEAINSKLSPEVADKWKIGEIPIIFHACRLGHDIGADPGLAQKFSAEFTNAIVIAPTGFDKFDGQGNELGPYKAKYENSFDGGYATPNTELSSEKGEWRKFSAGKEIARYSGNWTPKAVQTFLDVLLYKKK